MNDSQNSNQQVPTQPQGGVSNTTPQPDTTGMPVVPPAVPNPPMESGEPAVGTPTMPPAGETPTTPAVPAEMPTEGGTPVGEPQPQPEEGEMPSPAGGTGTPTQS